MTTDALLWHNTTRAPLERAIDDACAAFIRRTGLPPTHIALPIGEYPETIGKLKIETDKRILPNHLEVRSAYCHGDVVCMTCVAVKENNPRLEIGVSHGYCNLCGPVALQEFEAELTKRKQIKQLELI